MVLLAQDGEWASPAVLEEIVVTANRREQKLLDVSIAVTAITGEELDLFGVPDLTYLSQMSPNTTIEITPGTNTTMTAYIRGVGQQDPLVGFETGVGLYLDDVYMNRPQAALLDVYDVERIEILRGPQGTLYGRNTIGGAVRYITRPLADIPKLTTQLSYGTDNLLEGLLSASVPLNESFRVGGSVAYFSRDGFGENIYQGIENYNKDVLGFRGSMEWDATEKLQFRLAADYVEDNSNPRQGHHVLTGSFTGAPVLDDVFDTEAGLDFPDQQVKAWGISVVGKWQANQWLTVKNILAYREDESWLAMDFDSLPWAEFDSPINYENEQFSEELQVLFMGKQWNGILGFYYLDAHAFNAFDTIFATTGAVIGRPGLTFHTLGDVDTITWSVYGDFTYNFNERWSIDLGGRFTEDTRDAAIFGQTQLGGTSAWFGGHPIPIEINSDFHGKETFTKFTPRVVLAWDPIDTQHVYVSFSQGFRGGGFNPRGRTETAPDRDGDGLVSDDEIYEFMKFDPSTVDSLEFGLKSVLLNSRMSSNLAIFFSHYKDVQIPGSVPIDQNGDGIIEGYVNAVTNAARADINGVEWEGQAILAQDLGRNGSQLKLAWAIGYIDPQFKEWEFFGEDVADSREFRNTPDWTATGTLSYIMPMQLLHYPGSLTVITGLAYRSLTRQFESSSEELNQPAYTLWDLSIVWSDIPGNWNVGLHGKNLSDKEYIVSGINAPNLGLDGVITAFYGNPRQVWCTVQYTWF